MTWLMTWMREAEGRQHCCKASWNLARPCWGDDGGAAVACRVGGGGGD